MDLRSFYFLISLFFLNTSFSHTCRNDTVYCPIDSTEIVSCRTMSYTTTGSTYDFQKQGFIGNLYETMIVSCSKCQFSAYWEDFDTSYTPEEKIELLSIIEPFKSEKLTDSKEAEIAAALYLHFNEKFNVVANVYLIGSYFVRLDEEQKNYRIELQKKAIQYFILGIEKEEYEKEKTVAIINYLIGDLYRRIGDFENALTYYEKAEDIKEIDDWLEDMIDTQRKLAKNKNDDNSI